MHRHTQSSGVSSAGDSEGTFSDLLGNWIEFQGNGIIPRNYFKDIGKIISGSRVGIKQA